MMCNTRTFIVMGGLGFIITDFIVTMMLDLNCVQIDGGAVS